MLVLPTIDYEDIERFLTKLERLKEIVMGERITGGKVSERQPTIGEMVLDGAKRLAALTEGIDFVEHSVSSLVQIIVSNFDGEGHGFQFQNEMTISRVKLLGLLKEEQEHIGTQLARILNQLYGNEKR